MGRWIERIEVEAFQWTGKNFDEFQKLFVVLSVTISGDLEVQYSYNNFCTLAIGEWLVKHPKPSRSWRKMTDEEFKKTHKAIVEFTDPILPIKRVK